MTDQLESTAARLVEAAARRKLSLVTAESCTAGRLARALTDVPGASNVVEGGFIVYTKHCKSAALGVPPALLASGTAVCAGVAAAMASGALLRSPADIAMAITGVAGPQPDEDGNPVGLVYIAAQMDEGPATVSRLELEGGKETICAAAMTAVMELARALIK